MHAFYPEQGLSQRIKRRLSLYLLRANVRSAELDECALSEASSSLRRNRSGRASTAVRYLSLIPAPDFTAGMQRWDPSLLVFNEHGAVTVLKTTRPRYRGLGCTDRYRKKPQQRLACSPVIGVWNRFGVWWKLQTVRRTVPSQGAGSAIDFLPASLFPGWSPDYCCSHRRLLSKSNPLFVQSLLKKKM